MKNYNDTLRKSKKESPLKEIFKSSKTTIGLVGIVSAGLVSLSVLSKHTLRPKDFEESPWIYYHHETGIIWNYYMNKDIPHNSVNWHAYQKEVKKANDNYLKEWIILPDLDRNGRVGR